ncbi:MAG: hypothetical protein NVS2B11_06600 [Acetobacteraceae bacterium]
MWRFIVAAAPALARGEAVVRQHALDLLGARVGWECAEDQRAAEGDEQDQAQTEQQQSTHPRPWP